MFVVALDALLPACDEVVVVVPEGDVERARRLLAESGVASGGARVRTVVGGERRQDSVKRGLEALSPEIEIVLVHDAARPFASRGLTARVLAAAEAVGAAVPGTPVADTVKRIEGSGEGTRVLATLDRSMLRLAQTPQGFRREVLGNAYAALGDADVTDDASVVEIAGGDVAVVDGELGNTKITTAADLDAARSWANRALGLDRSARVGFGTDFHVLVRGRDLVLGGVSVPFDRGLDGHSDADVAAHAVCDALLGAVAAGDIGTHFPPGDPRFKGISSLTLLERVGEIVRERGFAVGSVDVTVVAEAPKLVPFIGSMCRALAGALGVEPDLVSVKATTTEGEGPEGRGEGMSARAVAVVRKSGEGT
jgi:2-C-methyl-D-erythritol 4-phosphate cytidylyltransferase/2-C-methyl-D-erythritol 2,4-cyclodiphosphate synthase